MCDRAITTTHLSAPSAPPSSSHLLLTLLSETCEAPSTADCLPAAQEGGEGAVQEEVVFLLYDTNTRTKGNKHGAFN